MCEPVQDFLTALKAKGITTCDYVPDADIDNVYVRIKGDKLPPTCFKVMFSREQDYKDTVSCCILCRILPLPKSKISEILEIVNRANIGYSPRFAKFWVDLQENYLSMDMQGDWPSWNAGAICCDALLACFSICDDIYPEFQKVL